MSGPSRRDFFALLAAPAVLSVSGVRAVLTAAGQTRPFRIRTITAGVGVTKLADLRQIEEAIGLLERARKVFEGYEYEVQTIRVATPPLLADSTPQAREAALRHLKTLDDLATERGVLVSIGPVLLADRADQELPAWAVELVRTTRNLNFTVVVAAPDRGVFGRAAAVAAETMVGLARSTPGGIGSFRFAASACIPPGSPFFPAAYHQGPDAFAIGLESASLVEHAFAEPHGSSSASDHLRDRLDQTLVPVERTALAIARREGKAYLGIDPSPAPGKDRSIGAAIEALARAPFGDAGTLEACGAITAALKSLRVRTCGYAGLMLPVLEDPVLARRATEGRYGVQDLLLYSSVCGTGLDTVPLPGDTPVEVVTRIIGDVAALSTRLRKPLSARLFLIPGTAAGEIAHFDDPYLTDSAVLPAQ
jgi:uncharacterized protein (UPF0210 family)